MLKKSVVLASVVALSVLGTACGGSSDSGSTASTAPSGGAAASPAASSGPKAPLRMLMQYGRFDPNKDFTAGLIKEKTGYDVTYDMLPAENYDEKLNLMVANKEDFDVMKLSATQFFKLATSGALEPLDDLVNKFGPNVNQAIKPQSWTSTTIDGKKYAVPETGSGVSVGEELIVRQDWLDELGLKMPTTPDELYTVLKTIKEKKNIVPLTGSKDSLYGDIAAAFGVPYGSTSDWVLKDGKLVHKAELPEMKEFLTYMNKLNAEGLLDPELAINTAAKAIEKFTSGKAAVYKLAWWNAPNTMTALTKNFPEAKVSVMPFLKGKDGKLSLSVTNGTSWYIAIPKYSKHKEDAMKLLNAKLEKETFKSLAIGIQGTHHEVKEGKFFPILPKFNDDLTNGSVFMTGVDETNYPIYWQARVRKDPVLQKFYEDFQKNAEGKLVEDPMSFAPPIDAISKNKQKLTKLLDDNVIKFISGSEPVANYDKFLTQWKAEGGTETIKAANDWYSTKK
jgi:putative aldouronate transport system substrate-binding protein